MGVRECGCTYSSIPFKISLSASSKCFSDVGLQDGRKLNSLFNNDLQHRQVVYLADSICFSRPQIIVITYLWPFSGTGLLSSLRAGMAMLYWRSDIHRGTTPNDLAAGLYSPEYMILFHRLFRLHNLYACIVDIH